MNTTPTTMNTASRVGLIAAVPAIGLAAALLVPTPAAAASDPLTLTGTCAGSLVGTYDVGTSAQMQVWYSDADGGTNCIKTVSTDGKADERYLRVWATAVGTDQTNSDEGYYRSYAGPIVLTGTTGTCISVKSQASPTTRVAGAASRTLTAEHCG